MDKDKEIRNRVDKALQSIDSIEAVNVSPFFKDKVIQKINAQSEETPKSTWTWLSPQVQLALLVVVIVFNVMAYLQINSTEYDDNVDSFAQMYGLSESDTNEFQFN